MAIFYYLFIIGDCMIKSNSHICLVTVDMTRKSVMYLPTLVNEVLRGKIPDKLAEHVRFFHYVGNNREIVRVLRENKNSSTPFEYNNSSRTYFVEESIEQISDRLNLFFLFELHSFVCSPNAISTKPSNSQIDTINFEYLCLLYHYLESKRINFFFAISGTVKQDKRYTVISDNDYHRVRTFLFLESIYNINDKMRVFYTIKEKNSPPVDDWVSFYAEDKLGSIKDISKESKSLFNEKKFGKILPLIQINQETYICLQSSAKISKSSNPNALIEKRLRELLEYYMVRLEKLFSDEVINYVKDTHDTDNLLEAIFFVSSLYYLKSSLRKKFDITLEETAVFHEKCIDFAQGCFQLLENSFYHIVKDDGWANIALRIRKKKYAASTGKNKKTQYEYELNISDLANDDSASIGIVNKFIQNHPNHGCPKIELKDFFGFNGGKALENFFLNKSNIANHYGLMILNNVVVSNNGSLQVRSGDELYPSSDNNDLENSLPWFNGTAYIINYPVKYETEEPDYYDSIAFENIVMSQDEKMPILDIYPKKRQELNHNLENNYTDYRSKETAVHSLKKKIEIRIKEWIAKNADDNSNNMPLVVVNFADAEDDIYYEIMAKAFFLILGDAESDFLYKINNLAFINLKSRHHAIRLFRHFALFYDRNGENKFLTDTNIFIVDKNAELPLHFMDNINDIIAEKNLLDVYGGMDSMAISVLNALGRSFDEQR